MVTFNKEGHLVMVSRHKITADEWLCRIEAQVEIVQHAKLDEGNSGNVYYLLETLLDMMPTEEQLKIIQEYAEGKEAEHGNL